MKKVLITLGLVSLLTVSCSNLSLIRSVMSESPDPDPTSLQALSNYNFQGEDFKIGRILDQDDIATKYYITYHSDGLNISGTMSVPQGPGPFPLLVLAHGSFEPDLYSNGMGLQREQKYFSHHGYVVLHPDYRNFADSDKDSTVDANLRIDYAIDIINAVKALKAANFTYVDRTKTALIGRSMGGGITPVILEAKPDIFQVAAIYSAASTDQVENWNRWKIQDPQLASTVTDAHGSPDDNPSYWKGISAVNYLAKIATPLLIQHGLEDPTIPYQTSENTFNRLHNLNKDVALFLYPQEHHSFAQSWPVVNQRTADFFALKLKLKQFR